MTCLRAEEATKPDIKRRRHCAVLASRDATGNLPFHINHTFKKQLCFLLNLTIPRKSISITTL